jgi:hypothetical protein
VFRRRDSSSPRREVSLLKSSQSYVTTDGQSATLSWCQAPPGAQDQFLLLSDSYGFVDAGCPHRRMDGSVVYNCCWSSPAQSFSGPSPVGFMTIFHCLRFVTPPVWRARSPYLYPPGTGCPVIPPGTGFHFRRLLRLASLRWRYSNPRLSVVLVI